MLELPQYVEGAFGMVRYLTIEAEIEAFAQRWGGIDLATFKRALNQGKGEDKLLAIFALGYAAELGTQALLRPYLHSSQSLEHWASAIVLGEMEDQEAISHLQTMLQEFLPAREASFTADDGLYDLWRIHVARLLGSCQQPPVIPALRQALVTIWDVLLKTSNRYKQLWFLYQDELAYALGCYDAFGALTGIHMPAYSLRVATIHLSCGHLKARERYPAALIPLGWNEKLQAEVARVLEQRFGLSTEEQNYYLNMYLQDYFERHVKLH